MDEGYGEEEEETVRFCGGVRTLDDEVGSGLASRFGLVASI